MLLALPPPPFLHLIIRDSLSRCEAKSLGPGMGKEKFFFFKTWSEVSFTLKLTIVYSDRIILNFVFVLHF